MNNFYQKRRALKSKLTRKLLFQYALSLILYALILLGLYILSYFVFSMRIWHTYDPFYTFFKLLSFVAPPVAALLGWAVITYYFISRPLRFVDELIDAAQILAQPDETPIQLSDALKTVQDEFNEVRSQTLRNARLARESEQRKNDLIVYLAHDLKTPLTSVIGYLSLLRDEPQISPELRAKYTGIALGKAERLEELINEFFDITRFNLTALTLEPERINLSRMAEQISSEFGPILAEKDLTWDLDIAPDIEYVCDPDKLERVFDNLIRNAVNYSYSGTQIRMTLQRYTAGIVLYVRNHGKTISPDKLERIFDQFFRLDSSRSSSTGGAGLGLAIAKEIVELHGGTIQADSKNESISFTVILPENVPG